MIRKLREFQIGQVIRQEGPATHRKKAGTPTMGGLLILGSVLIPTLLWADLANPFVWVAVLATAAFGAIGFADDYLKIVRKSHHGLLPRYKMGWQIVVGLGVGVALIVLNSENLYSTRLIFPFFKRFIPDIGWFYVPFAALVLVGATNAVNLTDGLDGLAISVFAVAAAAFTALAYVSDASRVRQLPAAGPDRTRGRGADDFLRRPGRREPRLPLVELIPRRHLHGRRRLAGPRRRARARGAADQAGVPARIRRRRLRDRGALGDHPGRHRSS